MNRVSSDLAASELIGRSLSGELSGDDQAELQEYLEAMDEPRREATENYARLSSLINKSVALSDRETLGESLSEGLTELSKERMRKSIRKAKLDSMAQTYNHDSQQVAEPPESYGVSQEEISDSREGVVRFTLLQKIGEGGLGTVWLARDERLKRNVALKEMSASAAKSSRQWRRFQREAEITGHLEHPNVVPLYVSGVNPNTGRPFYAMRFLGKQTLSEAIQEYHAKIANGTAEAIDLHRLLDAFQRVCQAIAYAHSRGVIHRDLKPDNVALDNFGQVLVLDWGLAKLEGDGELATRLALSGDGADAAMDQTIDGDVVGTPLYMAPEQAAGDLTQVDARTDVYGLGAILFAILTGNAPHEKSNASADGTLRVNEFLSSIVTSATPSPSAVNPSVPKDLEAICMRAMAKEKFARYKSAEELGAAVERWTAGQHEKKAKYERMRFAGHDLKSRMCVQMRQLIATAQFMVELPPIQGLASSLEGDPDEYTTWRERLSQILLALTKTKPNFSGFSFSQVTSDHARELVRVERSLQDQSNIRTVPQSRLRNSVVSTFHQAVMEQFPGESNVDFECTSAGTTHILCGVPVFDANTEDPFGIVVAEAEIVNLISTELKLMDNQDQLYLIDDFGNILFASSHQIGGSPQMTRKSQTAQDVFEDWEKIHAGMVAEPEYIDPDREVFGIRMPLPRKKNAIHIVLKAL